jgi:hypothetical protein
MSDRENSGTAMVPSSPATALVETASRREMAEVQGMIVLAKQFPRDEKRALDKIINACSRPGLAEVAVYEYARGGTPVTGPTIRVAEMIAQCWGNLQFGIRELEQRNGESTVEAFAWDLETNTRQSKVFQVPHLRHTKQGTTVLKDPRDIYEMVANQGARRLRACILGVVPGDVVEAATEQCELTMKTKVDVTPDTIKAMLDKFAEYGVTKEQVEARIQRRLDTITPAQFVNLRKIYNSLKDEMSKPEDWFASAPAAAAPGDVPPAAGKSKLASKLSRGKSASAPASASAAPTDEQKDLIGRLSPYADGFPKMFSRACGDVGIGEAEWRTAPADAMRRLLDRCDELSAPR